jgi:chromosome segregation ATPase
MGSIRSTVPELETKLQDAERRSDQLSRTIKEKSSHIRHLDRELDRARKQQSNAAPQDWRELSERCAMLKTSLEECQKEKEQLRSQLEESEERERNLRSRLREAQDAQLDQGAHTRRPQGTAEAKILAQSGSSNSARSKTPHLPSNRKWKHEYRRRVGEGQIWLYGYR